ncbi:hypothetical protein C1645_825358 [Glomus cerebriforme]|uniref:Uncharacterized protein n=1 Tax=Glomus cerebriforme TaxID=658196 RepID=A0A397SYK6_9GLOM|nr:hypothetical protein C1645_825358 [Glomus cerebriforme]
MSEHEYEISSPPPSLFLSDDDEININEFELEKLSLENFNKILDNYKIIDHLENVEFTSCVVIDFVKGKIQRCEETTKLRQLRNLFGTWQVDRKINCQDWEWAFDNIKQRQCISTLYFKNLKGHIHHCPGKGKRVMTCITENRVWI